MVLGHQHRLDRAPVAEAQQVAAGAVDRFVASIKRGKAKFRMGGKFGSNTRGQCGNLNEIRDLLAVDGAINLCGAVRRLVRGKDLPQFVKFHPYKDLRHLLEFNTGGPRIPRNLSGALCSGRKWYK